MKSRINMTTKGPLCKQIIVPISNENKFMASSSKYITNLNSLLKNIKLDIMADFVCADQHGIVITTNKVAFYLDLQTIEKYVKNTDHINLDDIEISHLPQSKSYLKIIGIPYLMENTNTLTNSSIIKTILKNNHIFNNVSIVLKPHVIKVSPKSDMTIVWLNI